MPAPDFRKLYDEHLEYVWNSLRRLGVGSAHLEDVAHEVFLTAWRKLGDYDPSRPLRPWLFGIAFRFASDFRDKASVRREVGDEHLEHERPDEQPGPEEQLQVTQSRALVRRALEQLPLERRAIFVMHELDGQPIPQVAAALDVPLNTAYSRLRLARRDFEAAVLTLQPQGARS